MVEVAFELRLSTLVTAGGAHEVAGALPETPEESDPPSGSSSSRSTVVGPRSASRRAAARQAKPPGIDKSVLPIGEPRRYRDKGHLKFVTSQPCLICGRRPCDPHHLRFVQTRALGRKVSDEFTVPLCRLHHRELHRSRDERAWWRRLGLDSVKIAEMLWKKTRLLGSNTAFGTTTSVGSAQTDRSQAPPIAAGALAADEPAAKSNDP
jgi:hypothetical protein